MALRLSAGASDGRKVMVQVFAPAFYVRPVGVQVSAGAFYVHQVAVQIFALALNVRRGVSRVSEHWRNAVCDRVFKAEGVFYGKAQPNSLRYRA